MSRTTKLTMAVCAVITGACATIAAPTQHLANAQGDLRAAEAVGTDRVPKAALHLQLAREELDKAKTLMDDKQNEAAEFMLRRAEADSELAIALAKNLPLEEKAQTVREELKQIQGTPSQN